MKLVLLSSEINFQFKEKKPKIGLLATTGTIKTGLYQKYFRGYQIILPTENDQTNLVMEGIYGKNGVKSGQIKNPRELFRMAAKKLHQQGADVVILGCTEISLALANEKNNGVKYINPVKILAKALVNQSLN